MLGVDAVKDVLSKRKGKPQLYGKMQDMLMREGRRKR
jgi:hypothetical protein